MRDKRIFVWDENTFAKMENGNFGAAITMKEKKLVMVGFLLQLAYDILISPNDNLYRSPGFECWLGIYGGE